MITNGPIGTAIAAMSADDAKAFVLAAFDALPIPDPFLHSVEIDGRTISLQVTVTRKWVGSCGDGRSALFSQVSVLLDGVAVDLGGHSEFFVERPYILMHDGTCETITGENGQPIQVPNLTEDLPNSYKTGLGDAIAFHLISRGVA